MSAMTDTATTTVTDGAAADPGCGCCKPAPLASTDDRVRELEARRDELQRRLADLDGAARS